MAWSFSALMGGAIFSQNGHLQRQAAAEYSRELCFQCPSLTTSHVHPRFPRNPPRTVVGFDPDSYGDSALPWDPVHVKVCVCLLRMVSPFPPVPWSSCTQAPLALNARCSGASFSQSQIPRRGDLMWGSQLSLLQVSLCEPISFQSVELPTQEVWGCLYREIAPPTS